MYLQGTPKVLIAKQSNRWLVWLEWELDFMEQQVSGFIPLTRYMPCRQEDGTTVREDVRCRAFSTIYLFQKEDEARLIADSLSKAFDSADIVESDQGPTDLEFCVP